VQPKLSIKKRRALVQRKQGGKAIGYYLSHENRFLFMDKDIYGNVISLAMMKEGMVGELFL
jgi:hypothetical protein